MAKQQRYIYPPQTIEGVEAIYANPDIGDGFTSINEQLSVYNILLDRTVIDKINLPKTWDVLHLSPSELATSASIFNIIDAFNFNFSYINSRSRLISNVLPGDFAGYYTNTGDNPGLPIYKSRSPDDTYVLPLTGYSLAGNIEIDDQAPLLSNTKGGQDLDNLVDGVWVRDNSAVATEFSEIPKENWHYGFLASPESITVVKMSSAPLNQTSPVSDPDGEFTGSSGWTILNRFTGVEQLPRDKNKLVYNNITKIKVSNSKTLYVLDKGQPKLGVSNISDSSQRTVIYRYDITGFTQTSNDKSIQYNNMLLLNTLGDVNNPTNASDIVNPVTFTIDGADNLIVYDEHDYTFKIYDKNNNFLKKYPKRNIVFRGAPGTTKKYTGVSDIHYDTYTDQLYVLSPTGYISVLDKNYKTIQTIQLERNTSNQGTNLTQADIDLKYYKSAQAGDRQNEIFNSLQFSKNESNIYYVLSNNRVVKRFKSRDFDIGTFNMLDHGIGIQADNDLNVHTQAHRADLKFMSVSQEVKLVTRSYTNDDGEVVYVIDQDRSYTYDQIYLYTDFIRVSTTGTQVPNNNNIGKKYILSFKERVNTRSALYEDNYNIYELGSTTSLSFKEYNSEFVYNKLMYKMLSNHVKFLESLMYKLTARYTSTGQLVYDKRMYIKEQEYYKLHKLSTDEKDYFVGINEYFSTAVLNRGFKKLYDLQQEIIKLLNIEINNTWPSTDLNSPIEPHLYTNGEKLLDIDGKPYVGYYHIREQPSGEIFVSGRDEKDGDTSNDGTPTSDRFLTEKE